MSTTDTVFLIITACSLSLFFILSSFLVILGIIVVNQAKKVVKKAENVVDSVEAAADVFKDTQGRLALLKLIKNIIKLAKRSRNE